VVSNVDIIIGTEVLIYKLVVNSSRKV
jgi:hypothetical protein